jgi:tetratricopeptide (TPR) repeat protein
MKWFPFKFSAVGIFLPLFAASISNGLAQASTSQFRPALTGENGDFELRLEPIPFLDSGGISRPNAIRLAASVSSAQIKLNFRDYTGALAALTDAVNANPKFATAYAIRARFEHQLGYDDDAFADCTKAIALNPNAPYPHTMRGFIEAESFRDYAAARTDLAEVIRLVPNSPGAYDDCALIERLSTNYSGAFQYLDRAFQAAKMQATYPQGGNPYKYLAWFQCDLGQYQPALENFRAAVNQNAADQSCWIHVWLLRARLGDRPGATADLIAHIASISKARSNLWLVMCERFLVGSVTEETLSDSASDPAVIGRIKRESLCSANYCIGMKHLLDGDKKSALLFFQKALRTAAYGYLDYESAQVEAAALEKQ